MYYLAWLKPHACIVSLLQLSDIYFLESYTHYNISIIFIWFLEILRAIPGTLVIEPRGSHTYDSQSSKILTIEIVRFQSCFHSFPANFWFLYLGPVIHQHTLRPGRSANVAYRQSCRAFHSLFLSSALSAHWNSDPLFAPTISSENPNGGYTNKKNPTPSLFQSPWSDCLKIILKWMVRAHFHRAA